MAAMAKSDHIDHHRANNEIDTRADTCCLGKNWRQLSTTGQFCSVQGFHKDLQAIDNVPVSRCATAIHAPSGELVILIINEGLYFGPGLDHSLINPNQIRHFGIPVSDDPFDATREFGIDHEDIFIPFVTQGSTVLFETFVPTDEELEKCPHVVLTDGEVEWDPHTVEMASDRPYGDVNEGGGTNIRAVTRELKAVQRRNREKHETTPVEHESDICLGSISRSLVPELLYERLIANVKVVRRPTEKREAPKKRIAHRATRREAKIKSEHRHSKVTAEHIARTWRISLDKAKQLLQVTEQKGVRTAVHPITRRY